MRLGVGVPAWGRLPLVDVVLEQLRWVANRMEEHGHEFVVVVAGSPPDRPTLPRLCAKWDAIYIEVDNRPLGAKFNASIRQCLELSCDAAMLLGSDDLVSLPLFLQWASLIDQGVDYMGILDLYCLDPVADQMIHWPGYTNHRSGESLGAGRCVSAHLLDALLWRPFDPSENISIDWSMTQLLRDRSFTSKMFSLGEIGAMMVDVKDPGSVNMMPEHGMVLDAHSTLLEHFQPHTIDRLYAAYEPARSQFRRNK